MKLYHILLLSLFLWGCDGFRKAPPANPYAIPTGPIDPSSPNQNFDPSSPNNQASSEFGVLKCDKPKAQVELFNTELRKFYSAIVDPNTVPFINCSGREDLKGGMFIKGEVNFENNDLFDPNSDTQRLEVSKDSYLEIHPVDVTGKLFVGIKMVAVPFAGGSIDGQFIVLNFQDPGPQPKGNVYMDGKVENGIFFGTFKYENFTSWQGGPGHRGQLGYFSIYTCNLLNCR